MNDWHQKVIDEQYGGDTKRFQDDLDDAIVEGRRYTVGWDDLVLGATTLPELKETAQNLIENRLGYLPSDQVILPFEPYLRALINSYWQNQIDEESFVQQAEDHIRLIRNADMMPNLCLTYDEAIYRNYYATFVPYGYAVKSRLTKFLGYEPKLEHSIIGEMWMRDLIARDEIKLPDTMTAADWKVITLIRYREVLLDKGQEAADKCSIIKNN